MENSRDMPTGVVEQLIQCAKRGADPRSKREAIKAIVSLLCLIFREPQSEEVNGLFISGLSDLSQEQLGRLAEEIVPRETLAWPSPGRLRRLLGVPSIEQRQADDAAKDLRIVLDTLERERLPYDGNRRRQWIAAAPIDRAGDRIWEALRILGSGSVAQGVDLLCGHPRFLRKDDVREPIGLELSALEKLEQRWLQAWRQAGQ